MLELAQAWNAAYNGPIITDPVLGYIVTSVLRVLLAWSALVMLAALQRYLRVAFPPPHTPSNVAYWLRWWLWLRLREFPDLKVGAALSALLLVLQVPAGVGGALAGASPYLLLVYPAFTVLLIGLARFVNTLTTRLRPLS
ncbi:hypothetical protein CBQ26_09055 [Deinococcus indicus]|uniref:Uncharacterized protein n=1 Tax=Deinococcus indicus TaxID=223556 RepID=A0A2D0A7Y1_9DEIO|nr:hypothetical protein [Deinococcus indicus]OWL96514.1 hypothetical protein CBQ26_09055 [Deinococcus indicus]